VPAGVDTVVELVADKVVARKAVVDKAVADRAVAVATGLADIEKEEQIELDTVERNPSADPLRESLTFLPRRTSLWKKRKREY